MTAVLDEALPHRLAILLREAGCSADPFPARWKGMKDGALLDAIDADGRTVLVTCDRNMPFQQSFEGRSIALVVVPGQRLLVLAPLVGAIVDAVSAAVPGTVTTIDGTGALRHFPD